MQLQGRFAGRYPVVAGMVVAALVPYLVLSGAFGALSPLIGKQLHLSAQAMQLSSGMANAAYAIGTVLAVQLALRFPQRRMQLIYVVLLLAGSILAASATSAAPFIIGHVLQGLCTSLLLIAALPPLIVGYPVEKARWTAIILNLCVFGAVALGPFIGGLQASAHSWRPLFWVVVAVAAGSLILSVLTFVDAPAADPGWPVDPLAVGLAAFGCAAAFFGASELLTHGFTDALTLAPLLGGLVLIAALLVFEYRGTCRLLEVRPLVSTMPTAGIFVAVCAAAASVSAVVISGTELSGRYPPLHAGLLFLPEFGGAAISALAFSVVFRRRALHYFILSGVILLAVGIVVVNGGSPPTQALTAVGAGLIGLGVGCSVTPALYLVGFSVRSARVQRVFAIVELLRGVAAFLIAPILLRVALATGGGLSSGASISLWICFAIAVFGAVVGVSLYALGRVNPPQPAFAEWLAGERTAWDSPRLLAGIRRSQPAEASGHEDAARQERILRALSEACGPSAKLRRKQMVIDRSENAPLAPLAPREDVS